MATKFAKVNSLTFPWLFPDQTPFFPDFNLTDFLTTHRFSLTLSTEFFFVMLPQAKILPCGDEYGTLKRIDVKITCKFPGFKNIFSNQCFFPDFAAFLCLFPWLFFTFLRQHVNSLTFPWIPWIPWFGGHPVVRTRTPPIFKKFFLPVLWSGYHVSNIWHQIFGIYDQFFINDNT